MKSEKQQIEVLDQVKMLREFKDKSFFADAIISLQRSLLHAMHDQTIPEEKALDISYFLELLYSVLHSVFESKEL